MATKEEIQEWQRLDVTKEFMEYVKDFMDHADRLVHNQLRENQLEDAALENAARVQLEEVLDIPERMITELEKESET